jgi:hypothetical protein
LRSSGAHRIEFGREGGDVGIKVRQMLVVFELEHAGQLSTRRKLVHVKFREIYFP